MFDYLKSLTNKESKQYNKAKYNLKFVGRVDLTDKFRILCVDTYKDNKNMLRRFKNELRWKFMLRYNIPILLFVLIGYFEFTKPKKDIEIPVYSLEQTTICDNKLITIKDEYLHVEKDEYGESLKDKYFEEKYIYDSIQYQVKKGTRNIIATLKIDENGEFHLHSLSAGNFFNMNAEVFKDLEPVELDAKYQELVDDIATFVLNSKATNNNISQSALKELKTLVEDEKAKVIITISNYEEVDTTTTKENNASYILFNILPGIVSIALIFGLREFLIYLLDAKKITTLKHENECLTEDENVKLSMFNYFNFINKAKYEYMIANDNRKIEIGKIIENDLEEDSKKYFRK